MIKCHISRLMGERKLKISDVARATGLHRNTINLLYAETAARIDFDTLERLCLLFRCNVSDLLEHMPGEAAPPEPPPPIAPRVQRRRPRTSKSLE